MRRLIHEMKRESANHSAPRLSTEHKCEQTLRLWEWKAGHDESTKFLSAKIKETVEEN